MCHHWIFTTRKLIQNISVEHRSSLKEETKNKKSSPPPPPTHLPALLNTHPLRPADTRAASCWAQTPLPAHLSRVSLSEFSIFSSAVRCKTGNVIDELLPKFALSIRKSSKECMNNHKLISLTTTNSYFLLKELHGTWNAFCLHSGLWPTSFLPFLVYRYIPLANLHPLSSHVTGFCFCFFFNNLW